MSCSFSRTKLVQKSRNIKKKMKVNENCSENLCFRLFFLCTLQKCVHVACIDFGVILYMHRPIHSSFSWLFLNSKGVIQSIQQSLIEFKVAARGSFPFCHWTVQEYKLKWECVCFTCASQFNQKAHHTREASVNVRARGRL